MEKDDLLMDSLAVDGIDYDTMADFAGFGDADMGNQKLTPVQKAKVGNALKKVSATAGLLKRAQSATGVNGSRTELLKRFPALPADIRQGLMNKSLQITEGNFFTHVLLNTGSNTNPATQELILTSQVFATGVTNLDRGMLPKGYFLLVSAIQFLFGDAPIAGGTPQVSQAPYGTIPAPLRNGSFEFVANGKYIVPEMSANIFDKTNRTDVDLGYFALDNPKLIEPQQSIKFNIKWQGLLTTFAANPAAKVVFHGSVIAPY